MIHLHRALIRQLRSVLHRGLSLTPRIATHPVYLDAGPHGLLVRGQTTDTVIEFHATTDCGSGRIAIPWDSLKRAEGTRPDAVTIELPDPQTAVARWLDRGIPQVAGLPVLDWTESPAAHPTKLESNPPRLLTALRDAAEITEPNPSQYSLSCLHLRGSRGQIEATDGGQLLVQSGFVFPWEDDVLVPAGKFFGNRDLPTDQPVDVGRADDWISFQFRPWTIRLRIPKEGRFPNVDGHVPEAGAVQSRLQVHETDARFLTEAISRLPGPEAMNSPITVDLNGSLAIRARPEGDGPQPATELILSNSSRTGEPIRFNTNRQYLDRALRFGFREFGLCNADVAACGRDESRSYIWAVLSQAGAILHDVTTTRIESPPASVQPSNHSLPRRTPMPRTRPPTAASTDVEPAPLTEPVPPPSPFAQLETLRTTLRQALQQSGELLLTLKRQKKQSRLVESTLASLRELQSAGV